MDTDDRNMENEGRLGCPEMESLAAEYAEGLLSKPERRRIEEHLAVCPACSSAMDDMREALALFRKVEGAEVPAGLVRRILEETTGKLTFKQRLRLWVRPVLEPRLALGMAMALISFSIVMRAAGADVAQLSLADFQPSRVYSRLNRRVHLEAAKAVKYYHDLRVVYEIQTQLQAIRETTAPAQPAPQPGQQQQQNPRPPALNKWSSHTVYLAAAIF